MKKFALLACSLLFLLCMWGWSLSQPKNSQAQNTPSGGPLVGTHLGEGDATFQAEIMDMLKEKGAEPGFPVTIQVYMDSSDADIQKLGEAARRNQFFAIVRIDRTCEKSVKLEIFDKIRNAFQDNFVIEFGNEVNNRVAECKNTQINPYEQYRLNLNDIQGLISSGLVGPSVLDFYNSVDLASNFLDHGNMESLYYGKSQFTFANAYGCMEGGTTTETCDPVATTTYELAYAPLKAKGKPFYITEFSLGPTSNKDLKKVKTFIETHAEKTGALKVTPLVFNVCNGQGTWLLYLHGEFYTNKGSRVNPETCTSDKNPFYLEPLKSLLREEPNGDEVYNELKSKHYKPVCVASWEFSPEVKADDIEKALLEGQTRTVDGSLDIKDNAPVPYLRQAGVLDSFSSFEEYLGTQQSDLLGDEVSDSIVGGPLYKLQSGVQRCEQQVKMLEKIKEKCNELQDPSECALDEQFADSDYTPTQLLNEFQGSGMSCERLESSTDAELNPQELQIRTVLRQTEMVMNKFYKLGFVIFIIEQETDGNSGGLGGLLRKAFNFLASNSTVSKQQMVVLSTKLPSTLTEEIETENTSYKDSLHQTASILTPIAQQKSEKEKIDQLYSSGRANNAPGENFIDCNSDDCKKPLNQALEKLTEQYLENPEDCMPFAQPIYEESSDLKDVGDLSQLDQKYQTTSGDGDLKAELEEQSFLDGVGSAITNAAGEVVSSAGNIIAKFFSTIQGNDTNKEKPAKPKLKMIYVTQWSEQKENIDHRLGYSFLSYRQVQNIEADKERFPELSRMTESFLSSVFSEAEFAPVPKRNCVPDPEDPTSCQSIAKATVMVGNFHEPGPPAGGSKILFPAKYIVSAFGSALSKALQSWEQNNNKVESYLVGAQVQEDTGSIDDDTNTKVGPMCTHAKNTITVYDERRTAEIIANVARSYGLSPSFLYGIFKIENGSGRENSYRQKMAGLAPGQTATILCGDTINNCGAMGPMALVDGRCANTQCKNYAGVQNITRDADICTLEGALTVAAAKLSADKDWLGGNEYWAAARYAGYINADEDGNPITDDIGAKCENLPAISGCNGLNYCQCAVDGFDNQWADLGVL